MADLQRSSFTLPQSFLDDLSYISQRVGVSRSALLADMAGQPLHDLRVLLEAVPPAPTSEDVLRFRGKSADVVSQRLDDLKRIGIDLARVEVSS